VREREHRPARRPGRPSRRGSTTRALAIGVEKQYNEDRAKVMQSFIAGTDVQEMAARVSELRKPSRRRGRSPAGGKRPGPGGRRPVVTPRSWTSTRREPAPTWRRTIHAEAARPSRLSKESQQLDEESPGAVHVSADRGGGVERPIVACHAHPGDVRADRDGAAAAIICSQSFLSKHPSGGRSGSPPRSWKGERGPGSATSASAPPSKAFAIAGIGPEDVDVMEVHDATAFGEISVDGGPRFCRGVKAA